MDARACVYLRMRVDYVVAVNPLQDRQEHRQHLLGPVLISGLSRVRAHARQGGKENRRGGERAQKRMDRKDKLEGESEASKNVYAQYLAHGHTESARTRMQV